MGYEKKKLKDCCVFVSDGDHLPPPKTKTGIPFITISDIDSNNQLSFENAMYVPESYYEGLAENKKAQKGDILYSVVGSFGIPIYIEDNKKFVFQRHIAILRPNDSLDSRYLYYVMLNPQFYKLVDKLAIGCSQRTVTLDTLRNIEIEVPPIGVQRNIVSVLEKVDAQIMCNNKVCITLQEATKTLFNYWFTQFDFPNEDGKPYKSSGGEMIWCEELKREIPKGWTVCSLNDLCSFRNGINYDKNCEGTKKYRIINVRNITASNLLLNNNDFDEIVLPQEQGDRYLLKEDDIIIARSGSPGATRLLLNSDDSTIFCGFIICCTPNNSMHRVFLTYLLKSLEGTSATKTGGSILQNVSQDTLKSLKVCLPTSDVLQAFNDLVNPLFSLMQNKMVQNNQLIEQRDWLLPLLMNGQATIKQETTK